MNGILISHCNLFINATVKGKGSFKLISYLVTLLNSLLVLINQELIEWCFYVDHPTLTNYDSCVASFKIHKYLISFIYHTVISRNTDNELFFLVLDPKINGW